MNMKKFLAALISLSSVAISAKADVWTLNRTVRTAVDVSNRVTVEKLNAESAALDAVSAARGWYPEVSLTSGAQIVSEVMEIALPFKTIRFGDYDSYDFRLRFNQLIYDGGRLNALREASEKRSLMSSYQAKAVALRVEYLAKAAFWGVVMAEKTVQVSKQSVLEAEHHLRDVRARLREGMALENDVLRAQLRIAQKEMDMVSCQADLERAQAAFRHVTGLGPDDEIRIEWSEQEFLKAVSPHIAKALEMRPELKMYNAALAASEKSAERARADLLPDVALFGAFNYGKPGLDLPANEWMHYFSGGILLKWNVWDWGISSRNVEKVLLTRKKTMQNREDFTRQLTRQCADVITEYNETQQREKLASQAADFAQRQMELLNSSYRAGMATETDYDNAHAAFTRAALEKSVAAVAVRLAEAKIEYVLGIPYSVSGGSDE